MRYPSSDGVYLRITRTGVSTQHQPARSILLIVPLFVRSWGAVYICGSLCRLFADNLERRKRVWYVSCSIFFFHQVYGTLDLGFIACVDGALNLLCFSGCCSCWVLGRKG